jgi:hypothetical protein
MGASSAGASFMGASNMVLLGVYPDGRGGPSSQDLT